MVIYIILVQEPVQDDLNKGDAKIAAIAVEQGKNRKNSIINAIGPETFTYKELVREIGIIIGKKRPIISIPPALGYIAGKMMGFFVKDVMITSVISIKPYMSIIELAQQMITEKPKVYPIVDDDGYLLGTINRSSLLNAIDLQLHYGYKIRKLK